MMFPLACPGEVAQDLLENLTSTPYTTFPTTTGSRDVYDHTWLDLTTGASDSGLHTGTTNGFPTEPPSLDHWLLLLKVCGKETSIVKGLREKIISF